MESIADGFRGSDAIAGAVVIAEGSSSCELAVENAVSAVRDTFAEGVAYGVADVLEDTVSTIYEDDSALGVSLAVTAVLGSDAWIYYRGTCTVILSGNDEDWRVHLEEGRVIHVPLRPGQVLFLASGRLSGRLSSESVTHALSRGWISLDRSLRELVETTGIRFEEFGCSAGCVGIEKHSRLRKLVSLRNIVYPVIAVIVTLLLIFLLCRNRGIGGQQNHLFQNEGEVESSEDDVVMPLSE